MFFLCKGMSLPCEQYDPPLEVEGIKGSESLSYFCLETTKFVKLEYLADLDMQIKISMMLIPTHVIDPFILLNKKAFPVNWSNKWLQDVDIARYKNLFVNN